MVQTAVFALIFLSTPSARRATPPSRTLRRVSCISIHALREEGDSFLTHSSAGQHISIHALREEGDTATETP